MKRSTNHHDEWEKEYWATQPEPKPGTREHLEKYGDNWVKMLCEIVALVLFVGAVMLWGGLLTGAV